VRAGLTNRHSPSLHLMGAGPHCEREHECQDSYGSGSTESHVHATRADPQDLVVPLVAPRRRRLETSV